MSNASEVVRTLSFTAGLSAEQQEQLDEVLAAFQEAWQHRPRVEEFLPDVAPLRRAALAELALAELELRLKAGEPARAEDYLGRFPELVDEPAIACELIATEYGLRRRREPGVGREEYCRRFPHFRDSLLQRLPEEADTPSSALLHTPMPHVGPAERHGPADVPHVPGYEVLGELGRGGMGVVYKAKQLRPQRLVALKMIHCGGPEAAQRERFRRESEATAQLNHPNIVQLYEVGEAGGGPYFSLELVEGGSLRDHLAGTPLEPRQAAALLETLATAMHYAHSRGVVHRDLKPANILLASGGREPPGPASTGGRFDGPGGSRPPLAAPVAKIADFGLAKRLDESGLSRTGDLMGTPSYMAPEQARGDGKHVGPAADVYALGAILYECLTGRPPFKAAVYADTVLQVLGDEPAAPRALNRKVPRDLETICLKCLRKEPARRYATAQALAEDLRRFLDGRPVLARPVGPLERFGRWCGRNPRVAVLAASLLVLLVGTLVSVTALYLRAERERQHAVKEEEAARHARAAAEASAAEALAQQTRAVQEAHKAVLVTDFLHGMFLASDPLGATDSAFQFIAPLDRSDVTARDLLDRGAARIADDPRAPPAVRAAILDTIGTVYRSLGRYEEAEKHLRAGLALRQTTPNVPPLDLATSLHNVGWLESDQGKLVEAEKSLREALRLRQEHGADDLAVTATEMNLGLLLLLRDEPEEAETMFRDALERRRKLLGGDDNPRVAVAKLALATCYVDQDRWMDAMPLTADAMRVIQEKAGDKNVASAVALFQKGVFKSMVWNDQVGGEKDLRACLEPLQKAFGDRHLYTAIPLYQLGTTLEKAGKPREAEEKFRECLAILRERKALRHPRAFRLVAHLARMLAARGDRDGVEGLLTEGQAALRVAFGAEHVVVADALTQGAVARDLLGDRNGVEQDLREALRIYDKAGSRPRRLYSAALHHLGYVHLLRGENAAAEGYFRKSLDVERRLRAPDAEAVASATANLIRALGRQGLYGPEMKALLDELETTVRSLKGPHLALWHILRAIYHQRNGRYVEAAAAAVESRLRAPRDPVRLFDAALVLAACAELVAKAELPEAERDALRQAYADEAMTALQRAVAHGLDVRRVQAAPELAPLRSRKDYAALLRQPEGPKQP